MKKMSNSLLKAIFILVVYLLLIVVWGTSFVIWIVEESEYWALIWLISSVVILVLAFFVDAYSKDYKIKYYFLGKNFKKQRDQYLKNHNLLSKKEKRQVIKDMKLNYRRFGNIEYVYEEYKITPITLYYEDFVTFNYGNSLEKQKIEFIIYALYSKILTGGGFYRYFETIAEEPFSFDEYVSIVDKTNLSNNLKDFITNSKSKLIFEYSKNFDKLSDREHNIMENYELNESDLLYDYQDEIFDIVKKIAIDKFFEYYKNQGLSNNAVEAYISKDNFNRITICYLKNLNVYNVVRENFIIYNEEYINLHSEGGWAEHKGISYFETKELAFNEIRKELKNYNKIKI